MKANSSLAKQTEQLVELINDKLEENSFITFEHLARFEEQIFGSSNYKFAELLNRNRDLLEKRNIRIRTSERQNTEAKEIDDPLLSDHLNQLKYSLSGNQANYDEEKKRQMIEKLVSSYYGTEFSFCEKENISTVPKPGLFVMYENALIAGLENEPLSTPGEKRSRLLKEITECPVLEDISEHVNWRSEYAAAFGPSLKKYLIANPPESISVDLLETEPGHLLKLVSNTDLEQLKTSIENGDAVSACAQLISLLALKYCSLATAPQALIVNEMQSALSVLLQRTSRESYSVNDLINKYYER